MFGHMIFVFPRSVVQCCGFLNVVVVVVVVVAVVVVVVVVVLVFLWS